MSIASFTGDVTLDVPEGLAELNIAGINLGPRLWALCGAMDGSEISVRLRQVNLDGDIIEAIEMSVVNNTFLKKKMIRRLIQGADGEISFSLIENVQFYLKEEYQKQGIGRASVQVQAKEARIFGISKITAMAANRPASGWVAWPNLGFDCQIPDDILIKIKADTRANEKIKAADALPISYLFEADLFKLWETYGTGCIMELDLTSDVTWSFKKLFELERK